jgi:hypothetical protein
MSDDLEQKRHCAAYSNHISWLRSAAPHLTAEQMDEQALVKVDEAVYGVGAPRNAKGELQQMGIGSKGRETPNHLAAIKKWEGIEAYNREIARIWRETPEHAKKLGLPQPRAT